MMLADLGADVIKLEHPTRGDDTRAWLPPVRRSPACQLTEQSAPLIEQPPTPPSTPSGDAPPIVNDWSKLPPESAYFLSVNRGKRSLTVNLKAPEGVEIVHKLIADADILCVIAQRRH